MSTNRVKKIPKLQKIQKEKYHLAERLLIQDSTTMYLNQTELEF